MVVRLAARSRAGSALLGGLGGERRLVTGIRCVRNWRSAPATGSWWRVRERPRDFHRLPTGAWANQGLRARGNRSVPRPGGASRSASSGRSGPSCYSASHPTGPNKPHRGSPNTEFLTPLLARRESQPAQRQMSSIIEKI